MAKIEKALNRYHLREKEYPADYLKFVMRKPIWESWAYDSWDNEYRYELIENGFILTSAGLDGKFDTEDDIKCENKKVPDN